MYHSSEFPGEVDGGERGSSSTPQQCFVEIVILCVKPDHRTKVSGSPAYRKNTVPFKISKCHYLGMGGLKMLSFISPSQGFKFYPQHHFTTGLLEMGIWFLKEEMRRY